MTKPDFETMSRAELKNYLADHRDDSQAWDVFFAKLHQERSPDTQWYPAPVDDESIQITEQAIQQKVTGLEATTNE